jgi:hypothetical protein
MSSPSQSDTYDLEPTMASRYLTVAVFKSMVEKKILDDNIGSAYPAKDGKRVYKSIRCSHLEDIPASATHIAWYNRDLAIH